MAHRSSKQHTGEQTSPYCPLAVHLREGLEAVFHAGSDEECAPRMQDKWYAATNAAADGDMEYTCRRDAKSLHGLQIHER